MAARIDPHDAARTMHAAGLKPLVPYPGAKVGWKARCATCRHQVSPRLKDIHRGQGGCRYCAGLVTDPTAAADIMRDAGLQPLTAYRGALTPWPCRCHTCGNRGAPRYADVRRGGGCRFCAGQVVDYRTVAIDTMRAAGLEPLTRYPGASRPWACRCRTCNDHITPTYAAIQRDPLDRACRCRPQPAAVRRMGVYLMTHPRLGAVKVGIGTLTDNGFPRVANHRRYGWTLHAQWTDLPTPTAARAAERHILTRWQTQGIRGHVHPKQMPQAGWTETAPLHAVNLDDLVDQITLAITDHSDQYATDDAPMAEAA